MAAITATLVKDLRERTGCGMMECKKALTETQGDIDKAIELLRKAGAAKAVKKGDRIAAEGLVVLAISSNQKQAAVVEVNCETDFVAREEKFTNFCKAVANRALEELEADVSRLSTQLIDKSGKNTVEEQRLELVTQIGENISIRRIQVLKAEQGIIGAYLHGGKDVARIAALVNIDVNDPELAKNLAMHVAAMNPEGLSEQDISKARIATEKEIFMSQARETNSGKSDDILEKIIAGKLNKFVKEITLLGQNFVKDSKLTVEQLLKEKKANVKQFVRFEVGEGIEKKADNFVEEVMSQTRK